MEILRKTDNLVFKVYGVVRDIQQMPARGWSETVTWFLIWDKNPNIDLYGKGQYDWMWVLGSNYIPYDPDANRADTGPK